MPSVNLLATLSDYSEYTIARGQSQNITTDKVDDGVILKLLEAASRYLDEKTGRQFYPSVETDSYDTPEDSELLFSKDVLEVISLTNGDDTSIASTSYVLNPSGFTPYYSLTLKSSSNVNWEADSDNETLQVIDLVAICGYRKKYSQRAWKSAGTLGAAISDTTTLAFTMTAGHTVEAGQILKIDNELFNVNTKDGVTITPFYRGDNGSTAATHTNGSTVYRWMPEDGAEVCVLEIARAAYNRRFGQSTGESATITGAGVVLTPRDIPKMAEEFIRTHTRTV